MTIESPTDSLVDEEAVESLAADLRGDVLTPSDSGYEDAREVWNGLVDRHPALVVRCAGAADVATSLSFAEAHDLPLSVRGGAHHQTGSAVAEAGLVVDLSEMDDVRVDPAEQIAHVGPGCRAEDLHHETQPLGLAAPTGSAGDVGVGGSTLGGGIGWIRRKHGLAADALRAVQVVTPDGELRTASPDHNEDLFWAVRGGGGNFGVVTNFTFDLYEVGPIVAGLGVFYPGAERDTVIERYHELTQSAPRELTTTLLNGHVPNLPPIPDEAAGEEAVAIMGCYAGDVEAGQEAIAPFREIFEPILDMSEPMPYELLHDLGTMMFPWERNYCHRSVFADDLGAAVVDVVTERVDDAPSPLSAIGVWHLGGAVADVDSDATAYPHRDAEYLITTEANWDEGDDEANLEWARSVEEELREAGCYGAYAGFTGVDEQSFETWSEQVYGGNLSRLQEVKQRYDTANDLAKNVNVAPADD